MSATPLDHTAIGKPQGQLHADSAIAFHPLEARYSCDHCRRRKVKCDRTLPMCNVCKKYFQNCSYTPIRKQAVRRPKGIALADRLEKLERVLENIASRKEVVDTPSLISEAEPVDAQHLPHTQTLNLTSLSESSDFEWDLSEPGLLEHSDVDSSNLDSHDSPAYGGTSVELGSCPIFSQRGTQWIDNLVGDNSFSQMMKNFRKSEDQPYQRFDPSGGAPYELPPYFVADECVKGYLITLNRDTPLFQDGDITAILDQLLAGNTALGIGHRAAINAIVAHANFCCYSSQYMVESERYLRNALAAIPSILMQAPDMISIGALLCMAQYFVLSSERQPAVAILGSAVQLMLLAGYNNGNSDCNMSAEDKLHQQRLFWHAYTVDCGLTLRLGKAPAISEAVIIDLPAHHPTDSRGCLLFDDGSEVNLIRERVALAKLQGKTYSMLYSARALQQESPLQLHKNIMTLDHELQSWNSKIPELARPESPLNDLDMAQLVGLTSLHHIYFQLVISVHSRVFINLPDVDPTERAKKIIPSIALCVSAARASIALLDYHDYPRPFTTYLLRHVSWSVDILFVNILQNKEESRARDDIVLLEKVVRFFERFDPDHVNSASYRITKILCLIGTHAVYKTSLEELTQGCSMFWNISQLPFDNIGYTGARLFPVEQADLSTTAEQDRIQGYGIFDVPQMDLEWMMPFGFDTQYWPSQDNLQHGMDFYSF